MNAILENKSRIKFLEIMCDRAKKAAINAKNNHQQSMNVAIVSNVYSNQIAKLQH